MNFKLWGIYTFVLEDFKDWDYIIIPTEIVNDYIFGIVISLQVSPINNIYINDWLRRNVNRLHYNNVIKIDLQRWPEVLNEMKDFGFIGQVEKLEIRQKLGKIVEETPDNKCWYKGSWN